MNINRLYVYMYIYVYIYLHIFTHTKHAHAHSYCGHHNFKLWLMNMNTRIDLWEYSHRFIHLWEYPHRIFHMYIHLRLHTYAHKEMLTSFCKYQGPTCGL